MIALSQTTTGLLIGGAFTLAGVLLGIFGSYVGQRHAAKLDRLRARDERRIADVRRLGELVAGQHVALTLRTIVEKGTDEDEASYRDYLEMFLILERQPNAQFRQQLDDALRVGEDWNASLDNLDQLARVIGTELRRLEDG